MSIAAPSSPDWVRHRHCWEKIPIDERLAILARLRIEPFPWIALVHRISDETFLSPAHIKSLIMGVVLFGFDDPFITGARSLDEPAVVEMLRQQAAGNDARSRERIKRRAEYEATKARQAAKAAPAAEQPKKRRVVL